MATIQDLAEVINRLPAHDQSFAHSLVRQSRTRPLSPKQLPWVDKLYIKATQPAKARETVDLGNFSGIANIFATAKEHLKFPKIVISGLTLSMAGDRARVPGSINVVGDGDAWFGRILRDGRFEKSPRVECPAEVIEALRTFAANPAKVAGEHGRLTGNCCFCRKELTDPRSTEVGYGPICADHFGLPWGEKPKSLTQRELTLEVADTLLHDKQLRTDLVELAKKMEAGK